MRPAFYDNLEYRKKQSVKVKSLWVSGTYNFRKSPVILKTCQNFGCISQFEVKAFSRKKYCGKSCAVSANNRQRKIKLGLTDPLLFSKENLVSLYNSGLSMTDMAKSLDCSIHKIAYWMSSYGIERRSLSDAVYLKYNPRGDPFKIPANITTDQKLLYGLGLGIYWGEGDKMSLHGVRVTNTDPVMIRVFRRFLLEICNLEKRKLSYSIICFNDADPQIARKYWAKELKIFGEKFGKITQIPPQGKGTYKRKSKFGVCTLSVSNIKLKAWILQEISKLNAQVAQW